MGKIKLEGKNTTYKNGKIQTGNKKMKPENGNLENGKYKMGKYKIGNQKLQTNFFKREMGNRKNGEIPHYV